MTRAAAVIDDPDGPRAAVASIAAFELDACRVTYFVLALNEFEKADGHRFEQWPEAVRAIIEKQVARFHDEHPSASVKAITQGVARGACVLALHWRDKSCLSG